MNVKNDKIATIIVAIFAALSNFFIIKKFRHFIRNCHIEYVAPDEVMLLNKKANRLNLIALINFDTTDLYFISTITRIET